MQTALFLVLGFIVGLALCALRVHEHPRMSVFPTVVAGLFGSCAGVAAGEYWFVYQLDGLSPAGFIGGVLGTIVCVQLGDALSASVGAARHSQARQTRTT